MTKSGIRKRRKALEKNMAKKNIRLVDSKPENATDLTEIEARTLLLKKVAAAKKIAENLADTSRTYIQAIKSINKEFSCLQFQLIHQDLESIIMHVEDLEANGPKEAHSEVSLAESQAPEMPEEYEAAEICSEDPTPIRGS